MQARGRAAFGLADAGPRAQAGAFDAARTMLALAESAHLDALQGAAGMPTTWHRLITPKEDMEGEEYDAWLREATAHVAPDEGVIIRRIVSPKRGAAQADGAGTASGAEGT